MATPLGPKFPLGRVVCTPGASEKLDHAKIEELLRLHGELDKGTLADEDVEENEMSLREGFRIFSSYAVDGADGRTGKVLPGQDRIRLVFVLLVLKSAKNRQSLREGFKIFSSFAVDGADVWVITEPDRSVTTVLLPSEY